MVERVKLLMERIASARCETCGLLRDTPLTDDEERRIDVLLDAIKAAVNAAPPESRIAISDAARRAPQHKLDGTSVVFVDDSTAATFIAELLGRF